MVENGRLAHHAGFSRLGRTICFPIAESGWLAGVGAAIGPAPEEAAESDVVVLRGINAVFTHGNFMTLVKAARRRGARLVVVDSYCTRTARLADLHLNPRPAGSDALSPRFHDPAGPRNAQHHLQRHPFSRPAAAAAALDSPGGRQCARHRRWRLDGRLQ